MKKNIVIIIMAVAIAIMCVCLIITNNKLNDYSNEIMDMNLTNESLNNELDRVREIAGDQFVETLRLMDERDSLELELEQAQEISDIWEKLYYDDYDEYEDHSGVSLTKDNTYESELEYNSKSNDWG